MTVKELIVALRECPQDSHVVMEIDTVDGVYVGSPDTIYEDIQRPGAMRHVTAISGKGI